MNAMQIGFLGVVFAAVFGVSMVAMYLLSPSPLRQRLRNVDGKSPPAAESGRSKWIEKIVKVTGPLAKLSVPEKGWEESRLRTRFMNAGLRTASAPALFFAAKTVLAVGLPFAAFMFVRLGNSQLTGNALLALLLIAGAIGYYLPNAVLTRKVESRQREIFENFPDALDLLIVCIEAGLGLEAAIQRVADEMRLKSVTLAEELHLVTLELRAGAAKERALRNLALRTGVEDVDSLVAMLIQAERFGTSIADSLRVHAETLRTKRRLRAEEAAAKIALKLLFPLIFCIFPTLLLVLLGPAFIQIYRVLLPGIGGQ